MSSTTKGETDLAEVFGALDALNSGLRHHGAWAFAVGLNRACHRPSLSHINRPGSLWVRHLTTWGSLHRACAPQVDQDCCEHYAAPSQ